MSSYLAMSKILPGLPGKQIHAVNVADDTLIAVLLGHDFRVYVIDGSRIMDERTFFEEVAQVFEFPEYFGHGWASWDDCLGDFGFLAPERVAIIWKHADKTFAADAQTFLQAVCDLENLAIGATLHPLRHPEGGMEPKQIEIFFLGNGKGFKGLEPEERS
jgi:RNAse (barnase) inhibitor barstar